MINLISKSGVKIENHNCLAIATTEIIEFSPSLYPIIIRCQDSLKAFWLWCDTTKCDLALVRGLS